MNKFAEWMKNNDKKQRGVAEKLGVGNTTLHEILKNNQLPSMWLAYEIEKYTKGGVTLYDWVDQIEEKKNQITAVTKKPKRKEIKA